MEVNYLVKRKGEQGKYFTFGNVKKNKWDNYQLGLKAAPELRKLLADAKDGDWLNFSLFLDEGKKPAYAGDDQGVPF